MPHTQSMRIVSCTPAEAEQQITWLLDSSEHFGNDKLAAEARRGRAEYLAGASEVTVGHTTYRIEEAQAS